MFSDADVFQKKPDPNIDLLVFLESCGTDPVVHNIRIVIKEITKHKLTIGCDEKR